jgi:hypothetical protein
VSSPDPHPDLRALYAQVAQLAEAAASGCADPKLIEDTLSAVLAAMIELVEHRDGDRDPRRWQSLKLADRIEHVRALGATPDQLSQRFELSTSQIRRLLAARASHHARLACLTAGNQLPVDTKDPR